MSFKDQFNKECLAKNKISPKEPQLIDILLNVASNYKFIKATKYHQKRVVFHVNKNKITRELCDILLVLKINGEFRFSFIQNKNAVNKKNYNGLGTFKYNKGQHDLLTLYPTITINGIKSDILKYHQYKTITSYSVFYRDTHGQFDLDLASAIETDTKTYKSLATHNYNNLTKTNNEVLAYKSLNEIKQILCFGEKVDLNSKSFRDLLAIIRTFNIDVEFLTEFFGKEELPKNNIYNIDTNSDYKNFRVKNLLLIDVDNMNNEIVKDKLWRKSNN